MTRLTRRFEPSKRSLLRRLLVASLGGSRSMLIIFALMLLVQGSPSSQSRFFGLSTAAAAAATSSSAQNQPNSQSSPTTNVNQTLPTELSQKESLPSGAKSSESSKKANSGQQQQVTIIEQQPQSTDVSSMYVQIPIAEPADAGLSESGQHSGADSEQANADSSKATSWSGPWPKKFQIGYIKQSDLHQVLIESLKNDPFVSLGGVPQGGSQSGATKTPTSGASQQPAKKAPSGASKTLASDSASLMSAAKQQQAAAAMAQWPAPLSQAPQQSSRPMSKNVYMGAQQQQQQQPQQMNNFREAKLLQQQQQHQRELLRFQQQMSFNQQQAQRAYSQQPKMLHFNGQQQQQQQFQFANFPTSSFKNQPIYTISNGGFPSQAMQEQTPLVDPMQVMVAPQTSYNAANGNRATKQQQQPNDYHYSSWRPVTSDTKSEQAEVKTGGAGQFQTEYQAPADNFDDGFSAPSKDAAAGGSTMNRHPMLNNYLSSAGADSTAPKAPAKLSPAVSAKMKLQQQQQQSDSGTKGAAKSATKSATKGSTEASVKQAAAKGQQTTESGLELSVNRRRSQSSTPSAPNSTTTSAPSSSSSGASGEQATSTTTASTAGEEATTTTTSSSAAQQPNATQTTTSAPNTSTAEGETQEPDSEVIDSETTEPTSTTTTQPSAAASSTTSEQQQQQQQDMGSVAAASGSSSTTASSSTPLDQNEAEVATQGAITQQSTASLPALPESGSSEPPARTTASSQSTTTSGSQREETTPQSGADSSSQPSGSSEPSKTSGGEVEEPTEKAGAEKGAMDASMSDEALLAASVRTGADLGKMQQQQQAQSLQRAKLANSSGNKKARSSSSERLVQTSNAVQRAAKQAPNQANKLITKRPQSAGQRTAKQVVDATKGGAAKAQLKQAPGKKQQRAKQQQAKATEKPAAAKSTRMAPQSERLQQQQVVSMTAAQAQATAQTLASLLLARCMSSSGCAHLLDMCTTKQAAVPLAQFAASQAGPGDNSSLAWSMPGLTSSGLGGLTAALQADRVLRTFPQWKEAAESLVDQDSQSGYTLILPSNEALERLPEATVELWLSNSELMAQIIDAHLIDSAEQIDFGATQQAAGSGPRTPRTRLIKSKALQVNQHRDKMVTINGKRLVYANQAAPSGGRIHVIDGFLDWPTLTAANSGFAQTKPLDIMDTLKQCDKFDGFVTLAEGTGLTQILKQDGPMTVFVPSNEALRKIPDEELEVIKNNSTALKEFLMYHVVNGSYFSQDLRDGQQLASILDMRPIQVGVRVDGCSRRLVEANTSPMRRPDIVAKNGVIHILDWYLTVRDNEWCDPIGRSALSSSAASLASPSQSLSTPAASERLQQLASETSPSYATRMTMPANHKPAQQHSQLNEGSALVVSQQQQPAINHKVSTSQSTSTTSLANGVETHSIIVSATPLAVGDVNRVVATAT